MSNQRTAKLLDGTVRSRGKQIAPEMPCEEAEQHVEQTRPDRKPCRLKMEIAAPAVLIREHVPIAGGDCIPGGWQMQIEPRAHVYVAGLTPVKPWMRKHDLSSADQQREKRDRSSPMGRAHERGVTLPVRGRHCRTKLGRRKRLACTAISDRQTRIHKVGPSPMLWILQQTHTRLRRGGRQ